MHYEHQKLGFSFDLPEGWRRDEQNLTLSFHGPNGGLGIKSELVQIKIGTILPQYLSSESRAQYLAEPGAQVSRTRVGDEDNAVTLQRALDSEISLVRDGVHYTISHPQDPASLAAVACLTRSARFGSTDQAQAAIRSWSEPGAQAFREVLRASSPEEARDVLARAGMPGVRVTGGTLHSASEGTSEVVESDATGWTIVVLLIVVALIALGLYYVFS